MIQTVILAAIAVSGAMLLSVPSKGAQAESRPGAGVSAPQGSQDCTKVGEAGLENARVTSAELVAAGAFVPPAGTTPWLAGDPSFYKQLPPFCRVIASDKPTADSDIKIEVWMPATGWNGKFRGQGNGGFAGELDYRALGVAIAQGYATVATDTWGRAPEKLCCSRSATDISPIWFTESPTGTTARPIWTRRRQLRTRSSQGY